MIPLDEMTKNIPETRKVFERLNFNLQWTYNGKDYMDHWASLTLHQRNQIDEAYIDDTMALDNDK